MPETRGPALRTETGTEAESTCLGMGTVITHRVFGENAGLAVRAAEDEIARLERLLSRFLSDSDVSRVNASAGSGLQRISSETFEVLAKAAEFSVRGQGLFDVTMGPLVDLWRSAADSSTPPARTDIERVLRLVDHADLMLDPLGGTAGLKRAGQAIDLGGIGKGFAADRVRDVFRSRGIASAFTNVGGDVMALGAKPGGSPWRVGIQHPRRKGALVGSVAVIDRAVVTSGDYERCFFDGDGTRRHHILDPMTGYPSRSGLMSVTVIADSATAADALSTIVFIAGLEAGLGVLRAYPGADAVLVGDAHEVYMTEGLRDCFRAEDGIQLNVV
jgi:FAD:protein FMN transferase